MRVQDVCNLIKIADKRIRNRGNGTDEAEAILIALRLIYPTCRPLNRALVFLQARQFTKAAFELAAIFYADLGGQGDFKASVDVSKLEALS